MSKKTKLKKPDAIFVRQDQQLNELKASNITLAHHVDRIECLHREICEQVTALKSSTLSTGDELRRAKEIIGGMVLKGLMSHNLKWIDNPPGANDPWKMLT